jgi:hypothetical protein
VVEQPIRNRQVASSTLALGSNIPLEDKDLADSLNCLYPIRCKVVTNSEVFAQRIHRAHLRFIQALDVNVLTRHSSTWRCRKGVVRWQLASAAIHTNN